MTQTDVTRREIFGFCLFDFANSAYTTLIITAVYSLYFVQFVGSSFLWSLTLSLSYALTLLVSPVAGAMADYQGSKKRYLLFSTLLCVTATAGLFFTGKGTLPLVLGLLLLSNTGYALSENFVSSFLPGLSTRANIGRISGYAWSFGYVGGILSLLLMLVYFRAAGSGEAQVRACTLVAAGFFGLFALPAFLWLRERTSPEAPVPGLSVVTAGFARLAQTFRDIRRYGELFKFLTAFFLFSCGTATVITFAGIFAQQELHFTTPDVIKLILVANITSAAGAFFFGFVQDKIGAKRTLYITQALWLAAVLGAYFVHTPGRFWIVANVVGFAMGASQSASRSLVGLFSPPGKAAEFYGFWGVAGKGAAIAGLFSFGVMLKVFHNNMRIAILSTAVFFVLGTFGLLTVDEKKGTLL
ncbi:MAG: MFS transporter [Fibrobacterota bacterium]